MQSFNLVLTLALLILQSQIVLNILSLSLWNKRIFFLYNLVFKKQGWSPLLPAQESKGVWGKLTLEGAIVDALPVLGYRTPYIFTLAWLRNSALFAKTC